MPTLEQLADSPRTTLQPQQVDHFRRAERLGRLLDDAFRIPVIGRRVGWDALLGTIPFIGDWIAAVFSGFMLLEARKAGAPLSLLGRMVSNVAIDVVVGMVPVVGDLFDFAFKANRRNADLLRDYLVANGIGSTRVS